YDAPYVYVHLHFHEILARRTFHTHRFWQVRPGFSSNLDLSLLRSFAYDCVNSGSLILIVAGLAVGWRTDIILFHQLKASFNLVLNFIAHGSNFIDRAYVLLGVAVAVEAPAHAKGFNLANNFHSVNASVAALAPHAHINVGSVVKIGVIRQIVYTNPFNGLAGFPAFPNFL